MQNVSGPCEFFPLPVAANTTRGEAGAGEARAMTTATTPLGLTHVLAGILPPKPYRGGTAWYTLGHLDNATQKFTETTAPAPLDASDLLIYTQMHSDDNRLLFVGWWNVGLSCLAAPREVTYDAELQRLHALPVAELAQLRGESLGQHSTPTSISQGPSAAMPLFGKGQASTSFDLEAEVALPTDRGSSLDFGLALLASDSENAEVVVRITVSAATAGDDDDGRDAGVRTVNVTAGVPGTTGRQAGYNSSLAFPFPAAESVLALRVLADRTLVELFVGDGRGGAVLCCLACLLASRVL
jgi:sucrose-6-phosphate hydrolase SacC (GH32 family)